MSASPRAATPRVAIIGAGPAGLMAAETLATAGVAVDIYEALAAPARKFLRAGVGGLNLTHSEDLPRFIERYGVAAPVVADWLSAFGPAQVRDWAAGLGSETFIGSSGRVFPRAMKAAPLLRAWLQRLHEQGVRLHTRHRWLGWDDTGALRFETPQGERKVGVDGTACPEWGTACPERGTALGEVAAVILALGGGSWARLGADGRWLPLLAEQGIALAPLQPSNCGFVVEWSARLRERHAGAPLKNVALRLSPDAPHAWQGECVVSARGIEGGLIYAASAVLRDRIGRDGAATAYLDLFPQRTPTELAAALQRPRGRDSLSNHLRRQLKLVGVKTALIYECTDDASRSDMSRLATALKALPLRLVGMAPIDRAISTAGGVRLDELDPGLMLRRLPGVFCAGEMLDWDAPTGGYLLTACLAGGKRAGRGVLDFLAASGWR